MELPGESNAITRTNTPAKKIYITQWMEFNPKSEYGFSPNTSISDQPYTLKGIKSSLNFFKELVGYYSKKGFGSGTPTEFNNSKPIKIGNTNKDIEDFISFIKKYDGVGFAGANNNSNVVLPVLNSRKGILNLKLEDDVIRMFFFDLIHDLGKSSPKFKALTYGQFKRRFVAAVDELKGGHLVSGFKTGAGTTAKSYEQYETLVQKRNTGNANEVPAIFKTIGDLSQYIYAAKYNTTVASGDRMGIAVGLYVCAKMGFPVKTMIEDGITGFVLYTGRKQIKFSRGSVCRRGGNNSGVCIRNATTNISTNNLQVPPAIAQQMNAIEARKPKLPPNMRSLMSLWSNSAKVINETGVDEIIKTIKAFDGYWSKDDLKKFLNIVQTLQNRNNIKPNSELSRKLNVLRGEFRGQLPNNGKRTRSSVNNGGNAGTTPNRRIVNARPPPPTNNSRQPTPPAPPTNNAAKRRANLSAYINNLQTRLLNRNKIKYNFKKNTWMKNLSNNNTNSRLKIIKEQLNGIYKIQQGQGQGQGQKRARNNSNGQGQGQKRARNNSNGQGPNISMSLSG
jgi:hypothetical protein